MARKKDSLALFEVMGRKPKAPVGAPGVQAGVSALPPAATPTAGAATDAPAEGTASPPVQKAVEPSVTVWSAQPPRAVEPIVSRAGDQVRVSLNYIGWAVAGAALLVLLLGVFYLGRLSVRAPRMSVVADGPGEIGPDNPLPTAPGGGRATVAPTVRPSGKYCLMIQGSIPLTGQGMADAEKIVEYLKKNGEQAVVEKYPRNNPKHYVVKSVTAFDYPKTDARAGDYARKIAELGKKNKAEHAGYDFSQVPEAMFIPE